MSGLCSFRLLTPKMRVGSCGAACDKPRHWWRKQQGPHTLRPISMVQHIKLSFTVKRHSALLLFTLVLQQVLAEWEMASLCLNHRSTYLLSALSFSVARSLKYKMQKEHYWSPCSNQQESTVCSWALWLYLFIYFFACFTSRKCKFASPIFVPMLIELLLSISKAN